MLLKLTLVDSPLKELGEVCGNHVAITTNASVGSPHYPTRGDPGHQRRVGPMMTMCLSAVCRSCRRVRVTPYSPYLHTETRLQLSVV